LSLEACTQSSFESDSRNWCGQIVLRRHVDVTTMVEIATPQRLFRMAHVIRDADIRDVGDLTSELRGMQSDPSASGSGRRLDRGGRVGARMPGLIPAMYAPWRGRSA